MRQATCYISQTGKAFQQPLTCLKFEFDHLAAELRQECQGIILHKHTPNIFQQRMAIIRDRLAALEAKAAEFYALCDAGSQPKSPVMPKTDLPTNVIPIRIEEAA